MNWTEIIEVEALMLPSHESLENATASAGQRKNDGQRDSERVRGARIEGCEYNGKVLALALSNNLVLTIFSTIGGVQWSLDEAQSAAIDESRLPHVLQIRRPSGAIQEWRWKELLDGLLHQKVRGIAPSDTMLSLYARGVSDLLFTSVAVKRSGELLLVFNAE